MSEHGPIPFALWDAPKGGRVVGRSTTGLWSDVEWIEGPSTCAMWVQPDTPDG